MLKWLGGLIDSNEKQVKRLEPLVERVNALEPEFQSLSDEALRAKTGEFKARLAEAIADLCQQLAEANKQLDEAKQCLVSAASEWDKEEQTGQCKRLQTRLEELDKERHQKESEVLEGLLPEAFAAVREAARRTIGQRHFDVQLLGGIVLHQGKIAEMKTGEGKTLVATLPLYLNSLTGRGAHLVTVNDYLSRRDPYWMGPIFHALGVSVASIYPQQNPSDYSPSRLYDPTFDSGDPRWAHFRPITRKEAYEADITYGTSSEFGFDYLRDNMAMDLKQNVQRPQCYAIVDEVDNLLIDEARTPLIISGPAPEQVGDLYAAVNNLVARMKMKMVTHEPVTPEEKDAEAESEKEYDYIAYEKSRNARETGRGQEMLARAFGLKVEELFGGQDERGGTFEEAKRHHNILSIFRQSMLAHAIYRKDRDYVVKDGEVLIVDEFTGRLMFGRRYAEGLHQAIEAKEHVKVQQETMTFATVTIQNYFRMYGKLAGMTGTALTEAEEFHKIYKLEVVVIPTNKEMIREDFQDQIYKNEPGKFRAVEREIEALHKEGRPVLVGTVSIEKSETLSGMLTRKGIPHQVLNAKNHEKEAGIIARAGEPGAVTVATNMAGRGVDIILGGNPEGQSEKEWQEKHNKVVAVGGLHVIGTERHEARRIDNQLRGRSGRQGDPGSSRFFVSLEDDLMRRFGGDRIKTLMGWVGMDEDTPIENRLVSRTIEGSQVKVEGYHFDMRKHLVEFDDVVNKHRELIYEERRKILSGASLKANVLSMVRAEIQDIAATRLPDELGVNWDLPGLLSNVATIFPLPPSFKAETLSQMKREEIASKLIESSEVLYEAREKELGADNMRLLERLVMLKVVDSLWVEHLTAMENMRLQAGWATLQQTRAVDAYKNKGYEQFQVLLSTIQRDVVHTIYHVTIVKEEKPKEMASPMAKAAGHPAASPRVPSQAASSSKKVGRNDPCPCGSGKKYKHCHGR